MAALAHGTEALDGLCVPVADAVRARLEAVRADRALLASLARATRASVAPRRLRTLSPRARAIVAPLADPETRARADAWLGNLPRPRRGFSPPAGLARALARTRSTADSADARADELRELAAVGLLESDDGEPACPA